MPVVILVRHGRTKANADGILAGWSPGVHLDEVGEQQAIDVGSRLKPLRLSAIIASPLERTVETAEAISAAQRKSPGIQTDPRLGECAYGEWTGRSLSELARQPLWRSVQERPSSVTFPDGESMLAMQSRAVAAVHDWNSQLGDRSIYAMVSHGDVIKAIIADALGTHLDQFQRIVVDPASISVVRYGRRGTQVVHVNDRGSDLAPLARAARRRRVEAPVGGGSGER
jgi:probable phosphomutase (TIGR03848 family)